MFSIKLYEESIICFPNCVNLDAADESFFTAMGLYGAASKKGTE